MSESAEDGCNASSYGDPDMKYTVKVPVTVEKTNGTGIPRQRYLKVEVTADDDLEAAKIVTGRIQRMLADADYMSDV